MEYLNVLLNSIEKDIDYKLSSIREKLEALVESLPCIVEVNMSQRMIINTYFEPATEE